MSGTAYGVDFGTSTSAIVGCREGGMLVPVSDPAAKLRLPMIPTSVCVRQDGRLLVGWAAERTKRMNPAGFRAQFKRDFGTRAPALLGDRRLRPDEMATEVLAFLRELAGGQVAGGPPVRTVATVPAAWEDGLRAMMREAVGRAGFAAETLDLVAEPVAALAYAFHAHGSAERRTVLVYDLGGGTFDCALAEGTGAGHELIGVPGGLADVGGGAFDREVLRLLRERCGDAVDGLLDGPATDRLTLHRRLELIDTCEDVKCRLSVADSYEDLLTELDTPVLFELPRADFEEAIRPMLKETLAECDRLLAANGLGWEDVDGIAPVGGSCRIPLVRRMLAEHTGREILVVEEPELAVARGAALLAWVTRDAPPHAVTPAAGKPQSATGWPELKPDGRRERPRSRHTLHNTRIEFVNASGVEAHLYWVGYDGEPVLHSRLSAESSTVVDTYAGHPWQAITLDARFWGPYVPSQEPATVFFR